MNRGEFHSVVPQTTVCTLWKDTKHVAFLLNVHSSHTDRTLFYFLPSPPYAVNFKKNMDAFDRQEQLVRNYAIDRKPMRW